MNYNRTLSIERQRVINTMCEKKKKLWTVLPAAAHVAKPRDDHSTLEQQQKGTLTTTITIRQVDPPFAFVGRGGCVDQRVSLLPTVMFGVREEGMSFM